MKKVAVVTGGSRGLGREICSQLIDKGWRVFNIDKKLGKIHHPDYKHYTADVSSEKDLKNIKNSFVDYDVNIDLLVNNASINHIDYIKDLDLKDLEKVVETNVYGYFLTTRIFMDLLIPTKGTILNVTSTAAENPMTASLAYNITKAAQNMMTKQMARELTKIHDITVFGVAPNKIKGTEMSKYVDRVVPKVRGWTKEYAEKYAKKDSLVKSESEVKDIAEFIVFLVDKKRRHKQLSGCILDWGKE